MGRNHTQKIFLHRRAFDEDPRSLTPPLSLIQHLQEVAIFVTGVEHEQVTIEQSPTLDVRQ